MFATNITRVPAGQLNKVNDAVIGQHTASLGPRASRFQDQLGNGLWFNKNTITPMYDTAVGTLYAGHYRYVRLSSSASTPAVGQILFWDTLGNAAHDLYQVTTSEAGSTDTACLIAGIAINAITPGNYGYICDAGMVPVQFRATLTSTGAAGSRVYAAAAGAGADLGEADVIDSGGGATIANVTALMARFLGVAAEAPTDGGLKRVYLQFHNVRG